MHRIAFAGAMAFALLVANGSSAEPIDSRAFRDRLVSEVPKLGLLRQHDPATFESIASIYEAGERAGRPHDELIGQARAAFARVHSAKLAQAPDTLVLASIDSTIALARDLAKAAPDSCAAMFTGRPFGDIKPFLSPSTIESEDRVYEEALRLPPGTPKPMATDAEVAAAVGEAMLAAAKTMGLDGPTFLQAAMGNAPAPYVCKAQTEILVAMRSVDPAKAAAVFRRRFANQG